MDKALALTLKSSMIRLPFITNDLPGIGGAIKAVPEHFQVEEILPYAPCGEGEHLFIKLRRQGWNTAEVGRVLGLRFGLKSTDVGWGGRKDKHAVTTQTFSLRLPMAITIDEAMTSIEDLPFEFIELKRHGNKLKTGHVAANRFRITLSQIAPSAWQAAQAIGEKIRKNGIPNFYGEQRFGMRMGNIDRAAALLMRGKARGKKEGFMVSALQSALFNHWLTQRIERESFKTVLAGDVVKKTDTGGMFTVEDLEDAQQRFRDRKIIYTGPIFGHKMRPATDRAGEFEQELLASFGINPVVFKPLRAPGSRRAAIVYVDDLAIETITEGLEFTFTLPSGTYATTVLREFTHKSFCDLS